MYASPRPKPIFKICQISSVQSRQAFPFRKKIDTRANLRSFLSSRTGVHISIDHDLAYEVEMLNGSYELRGKLGVQLRFLSRTAQPPHQSSPKEAMAVNASHAIKFSLRKTSVKATKLEGPMHIPRSSESRQPWRRRRVQNGKRPRWSTSDLRSSSSQRYNYRDSTFTKR